MVASANENEEQKNTIQSSDSVFQTIVETIKTKVENVDNETKSIKSLHDIIAGMKLFSTSAFQKEIFLYYLLIHEIDMLSFKERFNCLTNLFKTNDDFNTEYIKENYSESTENTMRKHFYKKMVSFDGKFMVLLASGSSNVMKIWSNGWRNPTITEQEKENVKQWESSFNKKQCLYEKTVSEFKNKEVRETSFIGLISSNKKGTTDDTYSFKIKNMFHLRNSFGQRCGSFRWEEILSDNYKYALEYLGKEMVTLPPNIVSQLNIRQTCIAYEILLRYIRDKQNVCFFLTPEEVNSMDISHLALQVYDFGTQKTFGWAENKTKNKN